MGEANRSWRGDGEHIRGSPSLRTKKVTETKLEVRQDKKVNPFTLAAAAAGWTIWVAICGGGLFWVYSEFQQCRTTETCLFNRRG